MTIEEILDELGIPYANSGESHHVTDEFVGIDCPFCGSQQDGKYKLGISKRWFYCTCWSCGKHRLIETLSEASGTPTRDVGRLLGKNLSRDDIVAPKARLEDCRAIPPAELCGLLRPHREYLKSRGFDPAEVVRLWDVQALGQTVELWWRLYIPAFLRGELHNWTTRSVQPDCPKNWRYLSAKRGNYKTGIKDLIYGIDYCRHAIVVNEGCLDVWKVGPGAGGTFGVGYSDKQLLQIASFPVRVVCFDNEPAAQRRAEKLCRDLELLPGETYLATLTSGKDASRASRAEIKALRSYLK